LPLALGRARRYLGVDAFPSGRNFIMKHLILAAAAAATLISAPAFAALPVGAKAPEFSAPAFLAGAPFKFELAKDLKKGPVVLYFFPAAFTTGCSIEAHAFADAMDKFKAQGATVIGITAGATEKLAAFSTDTRYCSGKFPLASDEGAVIAKSYDATLSFGAKTISSRTSYVIAPDDTVILSYTDMAPEKHIDLTLDAVTKWRAAHGG
jgi:peroxiredoxin Q/BCP